MKSKDLVTGQDYRTRKGDTVTVISIGTHKEDTYSWGTDRTYPTLRATAADVLVDLKWNANAKPERRVVKASQIVGTVADVAAAHKEERKALAAARAAKDASDARKYARAKRLAKALGVDTFDVRVGSGYDSYTLSGTAVKAIEALLKEAKN